MKVCLSSRQTNEYLQKADEIKVQYRDRDSIFDLIEKYPTKTIILDCNTKEELNWKDIERYNILCKGNFICCLATINDIRTAEVMHIRRYFGYPISSFWELNSFISLGVEYALLDMELFFQMEKVSKFNVKIRAVPTVAYDDKLPHRNGINGRWIRPEDLESVYGNYIETIEFQECELSKEQALYRIYMEQKEWRQDLNLIIENLNYPAVNRMLKMTENRVNCGQRCEKGGFCTICFRAFDLANPDFFKDYPTENINS